MTAIGVINSFSAALDIFMIMFTFCKILSPKRHALLICSVLSAFSGCFFYFFTFSSYIKSINIEPSVYQLILNLYIFTACLIFIMTCFSEGIMKKLQTYILVLALTAFSTTFFLFIVSVISGVQVYNDTSLQSLGMSIYVMIRTAIIYAAPCIASYYICKRNILQLSKKAAFAIFGMLISATVLLLLVADQYNNTTTDSSDFSKISFTLSLMFTLLLSVSLFQMFKYIREQEAIKEEIYWTQKTQEMNVTHYRDMQEKASKINRIQHDFRDQISSLKLLIENNREESITSAENIIDGLQKQIEEARIPAYTSNTVVNNILSMKIQEAKEKGIEINPEVTIPSSVEGVEELDINILVINLLNNAIEGCEALDSKEDKVIIFKMSIQGNYLFIKTINKYNTLITDKKGRIKTTKADKSQHGIGLTIIDNITKKYKGERTVSLENNSFIHSIALRLY